METLVLGRSYEPVQRVPWQRAITLLFDGRVEVLAEYDRVVRSVTLEVPVPAVVRAVRARTVRRKGLRFSRENIYARDGGRCQYCGLDVPRHAFTFDHVTPRSKGGHTGWDNIVVACLPCNQRKGGRTPEEARLKLRSRPVRPTTLPGTLSLTLAWHPGMPVEWRQWLRDVRYWHSGLEQD